MATPDRLVDPIPEHSVVAVLGLGASGVAACRLLTLLGKRVIASDPRTTPPEGVPGSVELRLGGNDFGDATVAVLSPGLNPEWPENRERAGLSPLWAAWKAGGIEVWSEIELAIAATGLPTITIGGTDGKSTTAAMTRTLWEASGASALFGGNSWTALSTIVADGDAADACIAEVSAFQLWDGHRLKPRVSVLTNIAPDHLDHYDDEAAYVRAKLHVLAHQTPGDTVVLNAADPRLAAQRAPLQSRGVRVLGFALDAAEISGGRGEGAWDGVAFVDGADFVWRDGAAEVRVPVDVLPTPGLHNRKNALAAGLAVRALDATLGASALRAGLAGFVGLPHRLEHVRTRDDVAWFNDSKATNIHAAVTGLSSIERPVVAIVGGVDKRLALGPMFAALDASARHVVVLGEIADRFCDECGARAWSLTRVATLSDAVETAAGLARAGDAVVFSPGCSSFDMFKSFEHRGDVFRDLVLEL